MTVYIVLFIIFLIFVIHSAIRSIKRPHNFPPGPTFYPWVGNTIQVRREARRAGGQHILFEKWAQKYKSNVIGLKMGKEYAIVVHTYPLVKQVHLSEAFEGRPDNFFLRLRTMGTRKGITCTDGKLWYEHRNFVMKQLRHIGYGRTPMESQITEEAKNLVQYIHGLSEAPVWPASFLATSVINVLWCLTTGKRIEQGDERLKTLLILLNKRSKAFDLCGGFLAQIPWLRFIAPNGTGYNLVCQLNKELYSFIMSSINDHKENYSSKEEQNDLIYAYLKEMWSQNNSESTFNETQLVMTILDLFIAGAQTTSNTIDLALMMLAFREDIQMKLFEEIQANFENNELPHLSSKVRLPYMNAFIMEIQRFFHITPLTGPRRALWDTEICGYNIPKNTTILINLKSVLMDKSHWKDPGIFCPERFMGTDQNIAIDEYFIPFGQGRRRCLGDVLARSCMLSFLSMIVRNFKLKAPEGSILSTNLLPGITLSPKPYKIIFIKRI